ncbi:hypothetical protein A8C75_11885 [Marinobacterium aestuarii]|uniref:Reverse transcriptase domain-containing protein n=1 Tax=Marinobacterium aestuarii TaxID=1821621 RepID=A0A1A9F028_9GAMM|nr:hypothetical protein [Marinobacterium aestuarii]ANG63103.1 hypothetical protein A8C75_11885 [Marinobacterium aestuarii]
MTTALHSIAFKAQSHPRHRFQNLYGLLNSDLLYQSWGQLNKQAAAGIDGITMPEYRSNLVGNIQRVSRQLQQKCYRASAIKRIFIPKANGKRPVRSRRALDLFFDQARQGRGMDAEPPMRHRDVPSAVPGKLVQRVVLRLLRAAFFCLLFFGRWKKSESPRRAKPGLSDTGKTPTPR